MDNQQISTLIPIPILTGYFCDKLGNIYTVNRGKLKKMKIYHHKAKGKKLYLRVSLKDKKHRLVHRLICAAKIGRELLDNEEVNHLNGNTLENRWDNLEVSDRYGNVKHAVDSGLYCSGYEWYLVRGKIPTTIP